MRRAASVVLLLPGGHPVLGGLPVARVGGFRARLIALFAVAIIAAVVSVIVSGSLIAHQRAGRVAVSGRLPMAAWGPVSRVLGGHGSLYRAARAGSGFVARNPRQRLQANFSPAGVSVRSGTALLTMGLRGSGYGNTLRALGPVVPVARANRVLFRHGSLSEWYANGPLGLEQGFTLSARPAGRRAGPLTLTFTLSGSARVVLSRDHDVLTVSRGASSLTYRGLVATDARGRTLPAWLELRGRQLLLRVRDAEARYPLVIDPFIQQAKLTASDGAQLDQLGSSVAVSGDTIVAAADSKTVTGNTAQGAVYVFVKPASGWVNATETAKLTASDGASGDSLGRSVAISGDTIVAGAPFAGATDNSGPGAAAYVFVKPTGGWHNETETAKLTASDGTPGNLLGLSVGIAGDTIVAGAECADGSCQGAAYVFVKPNGGWRSEPATAKLTASDGAAGDDLGSAVAISRDTIVADAQCAVVNANFCQGAAYVFAKPNRGWRSETETAKLTASDGAASNFLGPVGISGDTVAAGAHNGPADAQRGAVYVFVKPRRGWRSETEAAKLTASDGAAGDALGWSVAVSGKTVVAGAPFASVNGNSGRGAAYVFAKPNDGWRSETESAKLTASDGAASDSLGWSL